MWTSNRRSSAAHPLRAGVVFALLAGLGLAACTAAETATPRSTTEAPIVTPLPASGELDPGTYLVTGFTVPFEITVPTGWESGDWFLFKFPGDEDGVAVNFQVPGFVPTDACSWKGAIAEVGPSPDAFVTAMAAQTSTVTTPPVEVTVGGFPGLEFDHSVESDVDIKDCDEKKICLHSSSADNCDRWHSFVNEHETYRVMDLNGERAVIAVLGSGSVEPELTEEARAVFDSITFVPDE